LGPGGPAIANGSGGVNVIEELQREFDELKKQCADIRGFL
jgi:hypothetical protein